MGLSVELIQRELMFFFNVVLFIVLIDIITVTTFMLIAVFIIVLLNWVAIVLVTSEPSSMPSIDPGLLLVRVDMVLVLIFFILIRREALNSLHVV